MSNWNSSKFEIFRKTSMVTLALVAPTPYVKDQSKGRAGVLMFTICPATGKMEYDWNSKEYFAISVNEIGQILAMIKGKDPGTLKGGNLELYHKNENTGATKKLVFAPASGGKMHFFVNYSGTKDGQSVRLSSSLDASSVEILKLLLDRAVVELCQWKV